MEDECGGRRAVTSYQRSEQNSTIAGHGNQCVCAGSSVGGPAVRGAALPSTPKRPRRSQGDKKHRLETVDERRKAVGSDKSPRQRLPPRGLRELHEAMDPARRSVGEV